MKKLFSTLFLITTLLLIISYASSQELKFPFYLKDSFPQTIRQSFLKSFVELPTSPVVVNEEGRQCIEMCFGNRPQCFKLEIQSGSFYIWMGDVNSTLNVQTNKFDPSKSKTLNRNRTDILLEYQDDKTLIGYQAIDDIYINSEKVLRGNFILAKRSDSFTNTEGMIGLGYNPSTFEEKFSFIDQLYDNGIISHKVFTQSFNTNERGELTFGQIPKHILDDPKNYGRCNALDRIENGKRYKNKNWQCELTGIFFGNNYSPDNVKSFYSNKVSFFSYRKRALVPLTFFDYLENTYFKDLISNKVCQRLHKGKYDIYSCVKDIIDAPDFNLLFGEWGMKLPSTELFKYRKENEAYEFIFYHKNDYEKYSLGRPIVRNFHMVYDKHNEQIGFYSNNFVIYTGTNNPLPPKTHEFKNDKVKKPTKKDEKIVRPIIGPEDILDEEEKEKYNVAPKYKSKSVSEAFVIQFILLIFVIVVSVILVCFCGFAYIRYRKRNKYPGLEYYKKQTDKISDAKIDI